MPGYLRNSPSQETLVSLLQLDPSPMDGYSDSDYTATDSDTDTASPDVEKELPPLPRITRDSAPRPTRPAATSSLGLSGSGHGSIYYLSRIQRFSSYTFSLFASLHMVNTSVIPLITRSVPASESYLLLAREIYQTRLSEPLLVGLPVLAHIAAGVALRFVRRNQNLRRYGGATPGLLPAKSSRAAHPDSHPPRRVAQPSPWPQFSTIALAGYGFAAFLAGHAFLNRGLPLLVEGDSANIGLAYVAHGFARHARAASWAAYTGLLGLGCGHMVWGWARWFGLAQSAGWTADMKCLTGNRAVDRATTKRRRRFWLGINGAALAATALWAAGGLGVVAVAGTAEESWVGRIYDGLFEKVGL